MLVDMICKELGVEKGEEWLANDGNKYRITVLGKLLYWHNNQRWYTSDDWDEVLIGRIKPII